MNETENTDRKSAFETKAVSHQCWEFHELGSFARAVRMREQNTDVYATVHVEKCAKTELLKPVAINIRRQGRAKIEQKPNK